jgi:hypothetical protein
LRSQIAVTIVADELTRSKEVAKQRVTPLSISETSHGQIIRDAEWQEANCKRWRRLQRVITYSDAESL